MLMFKDNVEHYMGHCFFFSPLIGLKWALKMKTYYKIGKPRTLKPSEFTIQKPNAFGDKKKKSQETPKFLKLFSFAGKSHETLEFNSETKKWESWSLKMSTI